MESALHRDVRDAADRAASLLITTTRVEAAVLPVFDGLGGFAMAAMRLSTYRKLRPGALEEVLFYDHPSGYERVHGSMLWLKEHQDSPTANAPPGAR